VSPKSRWLNVHDRGGLAVHRGFENKLIPRIAKLGPPHEMGFSRVDHREHGIQKDANLLLREPGGHAMFGHQADRFIFRAPWRHSPPASTRISVPPSAAPLTRR
jgi:hypothetical protein